MAFVDSITQVRSVEWAPSYLWDVKFPSAPSPFSEWFPATAIEQELLTVNSHSFEAGLTTFDFPKASASKTLSITFHDDEQHSLQRWLRDWVENGVFLQQGRYVNYLMDLVREVHVLKLDRRRIPISGSPEMYYVYPEGGMTFSGNSESGALDFTVSFRIAGSGSGASGTQFAGLGADPSSGAVG